VVDVTDLCYLSAVDAVGMFRRRELSPRELMEAIISRAEVVEPAINAFTDTYFEEALLAADAAADAYAKGVERPLEGLPLAVKDEVHIKGQRATEGSLLFADQIAADTDPFAQRLIDAGAVMHARTTTPEFSMAVVTWSHLHGVTRNPWNLDITCGGSSGGSGASLAAGTCTLATGSDIAGSIRIPASLNGLMGFKPPWGRVAESWPWNRDTYAASGPLARTVDDSALLQNIVSGPLSSDMFSLPPYRLPEPVPPGRGMRVAVSADLGYFDVSGEVVEALACAVSVLAAAGVACVPVEIGWTDEALTTAVTHLDFLSRSVLKSMLDGDGENGESAANGDGGDSYSDRTKGSGDSNVASKLTPYIRTWFEDRPEVTVEQWQQSWCYGEQMHHELHDKVFGAGFDALLCPTLTRTDIAADLGRVESSDLHNQLDFCMTYPFNILGRLPVMNVPVAVAASTGVPIGMQIVGPVHADVTCYRLAASLESESGFFFERHRPPLN